MSLGSATPRTAVVVVNVAQRNLSNNETCIQPFFQMSSMQGFKNSNKYYQPDVLPDEICGSWTHHGELVAKRLECIRGLYNAIFNLEIRRHQLKMMHGVSPELYLFLWLDSQPAAPIGPWLRWKTGCEVDLPLEWEKIGSLIKNSQINVVVFAKDTECLNGLRHDSGLEGSLYDSYLQNGRGEIWSSWRYPPMRVSEDSTITLPGTVKVGSGVAARPMVGSRRRANGVYSGRRDVAILKRGPYAKGTPVQRAGDKVMDIRGKRTTSAANRGTPFAIQLPALHSGCFPRSTMMQGPDPIQLSASHPGPQQQALNLAAYDHNNDSNYLQPQNAIAGPSSTPHSFSVKSRQYVPAANSIRPPAYTVDHVATPTEVGRCPNHTAFGNNVFPSIYPVPEGYNQYPAQGQGYSYATQPFSYTQQSQWSLSNDQYAQPMAGPSNVQMDSGPSAWRRGDFSRDNMRTESQAFEFNPKFL